MNLIKVTVLVEITFPSIIIRTTYLTVTGPGTLVFYMEPNKP